MSFYVAGRLSNIATVKRLIDRLEAIGAYGRCLYDWTIHGSIQGAGEESYAFLATKELDAVISAEVVFVVLPGGRGTHVELGAALASQKLATEKQIFVLYKKESDLVEEYLSIFYYHPGVTRKPLSAFLQEA
jgi:hypothetical protein